MNLFIYHKFPPVVWLLLVVLVMVGLQVLVELQLFTPQSVEIAELGKVKLVKKDTISPQSTSTVHGRLEAVLTRLKEQPNNQTRINRMHQTADKYGVLLRKVSYQNQKLPSGAMLRHEMQADLSGSYPSIRQFLRAVLAQDEAMAIESLEFSRSPGNVDVRAQVRIVLFASI